MPPERRGERTYHTASFSEIIAIVANSSPGNGPTMATDRCTGAVRAADGDIMSLASRGHANDLAHAWLCLRVQTALNIRADY